MHAYYHFLIMVCEWVPYSLPYDDYVFHAFVTTEGGDNMLKIEMIFLGYF